jgi:uncharacterized protein YbjT (DUF2867 family)
VAAAQLAVLVFGATGTAGSGIVDACLGSADVGEIRVIARRPLAGGDSKLRTFVHADFLRYDAVGEAFADIDACYYALGISVRQAPTEADYRRTTYDFAIAAAHAMRRGSPAATFHFVSGGGTSTDSRAMWARVKGETERDLAGIAATVCWRPAFIDGRGETGPRLYRAMRPIARLFRGFRSLYIASDDIGRAMIEATLAGIRSGVYENADIRRLAEAYRRRAA